MRPPARVAILKPDYGSNGGFERLLESLTESLRADGVAVEPVGFDALSRSPRCFGIPVPSGVRDQHHEYFQYLSLVERMDELDLDRFDVVVTSQPPTYLVRHPRVVAVFYHQARVFYDLSDVAVASGVVEPDVHAAAVEQIRRLDRSRVGDVRTWLAGSQEVADRLTHYWDIPTERIVPFRAGPMISTAPHTAAPYDPAGPALCVSRHEWPKRTELVVQAAHVDRAGSYELVGGGSRLDWVRTVDARFAADPIAARVDDPDATWRNTGPRLLAGPLGTGPGEIGPGTTNLRIHGETDDAARDAAYDRAGVVIAPAFREDYGLTVLEAFERGRPVIVCNDGGGLVELVEGTGAGIVVDPTASAIANTVQELRVSPVRARGLAEAAAEMAGRFRHAGAVATLRDAVEAALRGG